MKTAFIFQHYPPFAGAGARRAMSIIKNYVAYNSKNKDKFYLFTSEILAEEENVIVKYSKLSNKGNKRSFILRALEEIIFGLRIALHIAIKKYDRVILSSPSYLATIPISFALFLRKTPYVIELRDIYPESFAEAKIIKKNSYIYKFLKAISNKIYSNSIGIICATDGLRKLIKPYKNLPQIDVIYNGFDVHIDSLKIEKYSEFTVCFHGVLGVFQDIEGLVTVADKLKQFNINLIVIGYGIKEKLLKSSSNIKFLGKKSHEDTIKIISKCHLGLSLRNDDEISVNSFPVKIWEYIGLGIPSIISPISDAGNFVERNGFGQQVKFGNYDQIVNIILEQKISNNFEFSNRVNQEYSRKNTGRAVAKKIEEYFEGNIK